MVLQILNINQASPSSVGVLGEVATQEMTTNQNGLDHVTVCIHP